MRRRDGMDTGIDSVGLRGGRAGSRLQPVLKEHAAQRAKTPPSLVEESRSFAFKRNLNVFVAAPFIRGENLNDSGQIFHFQGTHNFFFFFFFLLLLLCVNGYRESPRYVESMACRHTVREK